MNSPLAGSTLLASLLRPGSEGNRPPSMVQALLTGGAGGMVGPGVGAGAGAGAGVPVAPGQGAPHSLVFSALIAAAAAQAGAQSGAQAGAQSRTQAGAAAPAPVGPAPAGGAPRDAALAAPAVDVHELAAALVAMPGMLPLPAALARFFETLQPGSGGDGAALVPGAGLHGAGMPGDLAGKLVATLAALDPESLALLDSAVTDPASLFAALAELAALPATPVPAPGEALPGAVQAPARPDILAAPGLVTGLREAAAALTDTSPVVAPLSPAEGLPKTGAAIAAPVVALRGLVVEAISPNTGASVLIGAGRDDIALANPATEQRAASAASLTPLRPAEPAPAPVFARQITQQIRGASFIDGQTRIALTPRGLGEIEIDLRADEAGKLRIVLRAENPAVLQALRGDREGLLQALTDGGAGGKGADLSFEDFSRRGRQGAEPGPRSGSAAAAQIEREETASPSPNPYRPLGTGTLDILT